MVEMRAVKCQSLVAVSKQLFCRPIQIDETDLRLCGNFAHGGRVLCQPLVTLLAVRQVGVLRLLEGNRRDEYDTRRTPAVVDRLFGLLDQLL